MLCLINSNHELYNYSGCTDLHTIIYHIVHYEKNLTISKKFKEPTFKSNALVNFIVRINLLYNFDLNIFNVIFLERRKRENGIIFTAANCKRLSEVTNLPFHPYGRNSTIINKSKHKKKHKIFEHHFDEIVVTWPVLFTRYRNPVHSLYSAAVK